jgi:hypothetical protein
MRRTNTLAVVSLVLGVAAFIMALPLLGSVGAIVAGHLARAQIRASHGTEEGDGMAVAGLVLGYVSLVPAIIAIVIALLIVAGVGILGVAAG